MKILSFGSLNCDYTYEVEHFLAPKETLAAKSMQRGFGGKGANQSIAFARAGLSIYHADRVGADGLFLGTSAAAALHAAVQVGRRPENQGKNIVVIVPDNGMKYLSTPMYRQK